MSDNNHPHPAYLVGGSPLWSRAPARDRQGKAYVDCLLLIPGLKHQGDAGIEACMQKIRHSLRQLEHAVVYVDLNIKLGLLWVSAEPIAGITLDITRAIQREIPAAKAIAADFNPEPPVEKKQGLLARLGDRVGLRRLGSGD